MGNKGSIVLETVKPPTGLNISRSGLSFTCGWTKGEKYSAQKFSWIIPGYSAYVSESVGKDASNKTISLSAASFHPYTNWVIRYFNFAVKSKSKKLGVWSGWEYKTIPLNAPWVDSLTVSPSDTYDNITSFTWSAQDRPENPLADIEMQTQVTYGNAVPNWNVPSYSYPASYTYTAQESSAVAAGPYTRWVRVRARGCAGVSGWVETHRTYGAPYAATNVRGSGVAQSGGINVKAWWNQPYDFAHPVDYTEACYAIAVPAAGLSCPSGTQFNRFSLLQGRGDYAANFISASLGADECLFVNVKSTHLLKSNVSSAALAMIGKLKAPEITSVEQDDSTYRATITASNKSSVPDSFLVVQYRTKSKPNEIWTLGVIPHGQTAVTVQCPNWSLEDAIEFGVYAAVGSSSSITRADGVSSYAVTARMKSDTTWQGGTVPHAPTTVTVSDTDRTDTVRITWDWSWSEADMAVISWADHEDAWESTSEPQEYEIPNIHANEWNISGLEVGKKWYFRVKLVKGTGENAVSGSWSKIVEKDLSSAPNTPVIMLSQKTITVDGSVTASWSYVSGDGTGQAFAELCEATYNNGTISYGTPIQTTESEQHITLFAAEEGWNVGETHYLCVRVTSASGRTTGWSIPVPVVVASPLSISIYETSLENGKLTELPMTVTVTGAGYGGTTSLAIERAEEYHIAQPDEREYNGFNGETVFLLTQTGEEQITINKTDLLGRLDDNAAYRIVATITDELGQSDEAELEFTVNWEHKAVIPTGEAYIDNTVAVITPDAESYEEGDTCDIYRLSADRPELIYKGATFGESYVDPYPAIGDFGGYRLVYRTYNDDCITDDRIIAWLDLPCSLDIVYSLIDFADGQVEVLYDASQSNSWEKDFKETRYLGGSVTGDWNKAVGRSSSLTGAVVTIKDQENMRMFRRLADYTGICHIRTVDGSSYSCDIQVDEDRNYDKQTIRGTYNLKITRVDSDELDGVTYDEWYDEESE